MVTMAPPEGEEDRSQAYYVIRVSGIASFYLILPIGFYISVLSYL